MAWEAIPEKTPTKVGQTYRLGYQIKAPYSDFLAGTIKNAIKSGVALRNLNPFDEFHKLVTVNSVYAVPPTVASHDVQIGRSVPWWIFVEFTKKAEPAPKVQTQQAGSADLVLIGGLIALIITAATAVLISGKRFEHLVTTIGETVDKTITGPTGALQKVLNPGLILAAFVLGFMFLSRK
jgi:hypothetical protein